MANSDNSQTICLSVPVFHFFLRRFVPVFHALCLGQIWGES